MKRRGELTTQQIVLLIILIISFVVILFLLWKMNLGEETKKDICHNSVVLISKGKGLVGQLDCKTNYICISGGGECEEFSYDSKIKINMNSNNPEKEIIDAIQKEISDCWWMFGEGKIDYTGVIEYNDYRCAICDTIKFDKTIQEKYTQIQFDNQLNTENNLLISTSEKYSIITGINKEAGEDDYIEPLVVKTDEMDLMNPKCDKFVSKA